MFSFIPKILFTAVLLMQNCKRTEDQVMSVNPNFFCPPFPETHSLLPALLRATALRTCMGFGVFDCLKPVDCSFAENVSCRLSAAPPDNLCKFACGKLGADGKPILFVKPSLSASPRPAERVMLFYRAVFFSRYCYSATNHSSCASIMPALSLYVCSCPDGTFMLPALSLSQS